MSIESNLKSIAESLKRIADAHDAVLDRLPAVSQAAAAPVESAAPAEAKPTVTTPSEAEAATDPSLAPLTVKDIEGFNDYLTQMAKYLGATGPARIKDVLNRHGIERLYEIGENRALLQAIQADVQVLTQEAA